MRETETDFNAKARRQENFPAIAGHNPSTGIQNIIFSDALDLGHGAENGIERADAQWTVIRHGQPVMTRSIGFQNDVAALLIDPAITVMFTE
jgi:hypothetical protein